MLSRKELAKIFNVNIRTIDNWVKAGMPSHKIGNTVRFDKEEVIKWFKDQ